MTDRERYQPTKVLGYQIAPNAFVYLLTCSDGRERVWASDTKSPSFRLDNAPLAGSQQEPAPVAIADPGASLEVRPSLDRW